MSAARGEHELFLDGPLFDGLPSLIAAAQELKTPLALIRQLSLMLEGEENSDEGLRMSQQITLTSERALRLTEDLTHSIRLSNALFKLEPINSQQLCKDIVAEISPLFAAHNRNIGVSRRKGQLLAVGNRDLLRRIILNFCDNALHYSEENKMTEIKVESLDGGQTVRLSVRDYGPPLSINTIDQVGDRLTHAPVTIDARPHSSGLRLYIASQFADVMNGRIGLTRHRDGSTFYVDLQASNQLSLL